MALLRVSLAGRPPVRGVQFHHPVPAAVDGSEEVGKDYRHMSADLQVCLAVLGVFGSACLPLQAQW